jgi:hypothetical protein
MWRGDLATERYILTLTADVTLFIHIGKTKKRAVGEHGNVRNIERQLFSFATKM